MKERRYFFKYASIIYRNSNRYYDRELARFGIGCGQQFFLLRVMENDGISMFDLANLGHYDKGTVTKAIQKLVEQGCLRIEQDPSDRRVRRIYVTEHGRDVAQAVYAIRDRWNDTLTRGLLPEQQEQAIQTMRIMAENAYRYMDEREGPGE